MVSVQTRSPHTSRTNLSSHDILYNRPLWFQKIYVFNLWCFVAFYADLVKNHFLRFTLFCQAKCFLSQFTCSLCGENWAENCACGEEMTNLIIISHMAPLWQCQNLGNSWLGRILLVEMNPIAYQIAAEGAEHLQDSGRPITFHDPVAAASECSKITVLPHPSNRCRFFIAPKAASPCHTHKSIFDIWPVWECAPSDVT